MFRIGDFSHLAQVSIRTLRYYDEIGLLKPAHIDRFTDYRYYTIEQLPRLNRILALKDLGFSLDQVVKVMKDDVPLEQLQGMLLLKQAELGQHIKDEEQCLRRIASRLKQIEREGKLSEYEVVIKRVDALTIVSSRVVVPTIDDMQRYRCSRLTAIRQWTRQEPKESTRELFLYHLPEFRDRYRGDRGAGGEPRAQAGRTGQPRGHARYAHSETICTTQWLVGHTRVARVGGRQRRSSRTAL